MVLCWKNCSKRCFSRIIFLPKSSSIFQYWWPPFFSLGRSRGFGIHSHWIGKNLYRTLWIPGAYYPGCPVKCIWKRRKRRLSKMFRILGHQVIPRPIFEKSWTFNSWTGFNLTLMLTQSRGRSLFSWSTITHDHFPKPWSTITHDHILKISWLAITIMIGDHFSDHYEFF